MSIDCYYKMIVTDICPDNTKWPRSIGDQFGTRIHNLLFDRGRNLFDSMHVINVELQIEFDTRSLHARNVGKVLTGEFAIWDFDFNIIASCI